MAKRLVKWTLDKAILKASKIVEGDAKSTKIEIGAEFDLTKLFPTFLEMKPVPQQLVVYGVKQKLMDSGASEIANYDGKIKRAKDKFTELIEGKWAGDRVNATGTAANKKVVSDMRQAAQVISLEGLVMKKAMSGKAGFEEFTEADQEKLDELMAAAVKVKNRK